MGRTKPRTISELMDVANRFADGENVYHNKRARSPEDDRTHRYNSQKCRSCNYDNHNQVAAGFKGRGNKVEERQSIGYCNRDNSCSNKQFQPRNYNLSPEEILKGPWHLHYAYVGGFRVARTRGTTQRTQRIRTQGAVRVRSTVR
jgi:hypothetical protein